MKIRTQFILSILVFGILIVTMSASTIITQQTINRIVNQENIVNNISSEANNLSYLGNNYMIYQESQQLSAWQNEYTSFSNNVTKLHGNTAAEKSLISHIQADVPQLKSVFDSVVSGLGSQSLNPGGTINNSIFQISWSRMSVQNQELESDSANLSHLLDTQANTTRQFSIVTLISLIALFGLYFLLNYFLIGNRTLKSIAKLKQGTAAIGSGNLDFKIAEKEHNEIGELSHAFNIMTANLKTVTASKMDLEAEMNERKKAEESLQESENKYRTLFENMSEGFALCQMIYDTVGKPVDYRFINVNPVMEKFIGLPRDQIIGNTIRAIAPNVQSKAIENFGRVAQNGEQVHFENFSRDLNRWFEAYAYQVKPGQFGFMALDIDDRKRAEKAIQNTLDRFYTVLSEMPMGILLVTESGLVEFANQSFCDVFDIKEAPTDLRNRTSPEIIEMISKAYLNPEKGVARISEILARGEPVKGEDVAMRGGRTVLRDFVPIRISENKYGRLWIHRDITERKQMEDALKDSEAKANALIKYAPTGIYEIDYRKQRFLSINDAMSTLSGYSKEELFALGPAVMLDDDSKKLFAERVRRQLAGEKIDDSAEYRVKRKDGTVMWVTLNIAFSADNPDVALVIGHDITERIEAENKVRESEKKFSQAFHSSPVGLVITQLPEGRWVDANDTYLNMLGYTREEVIGHTSADLNLYPDMETRDTIFKVLSEKGKIRNLELRLRTKSGRIVQTLSSVEKITISGQEHTLSTNVDITARKEAEGEIIHLASFPEYNPSPIVEVSPEGEIMYANPAARLRFPLMLRGQKRKFLMDFINAVKDSELSVSVKDVNFDEDWYEETMAYVPSTNTYRLYAREITLRKKFEDELGLRTAELEASNKELEAFSYSVSHDLRAPLRSITGFSHVLLEDYNDKLDDEGKSHLKRISDAGELMGQLMDDLLKLSRVTRSELNFEKINLSDMAHKIANELQKDEPERKVKVTIAPDMIAHGDKNLMGLVLQNLLGNAWKYSSKTSEPRIEMGTVMHEGKLTYFVRDNGVGFDMTYANKLFQPFQRLHQATEFAGTGIGLATVQRIIRRHGGKVWAEAKVGEGATFFFTLN